MTTSMRELRAQITTRLRDYADADRDDFDAHMAAAAVEWFLRDRHGLTARERRTLLAESDRLIKGLLADSANDEGLTLAHEEIHQAISLSRQRAMRDHENDSTEADEADQFLRDNTVVPNGE